MKRFYQCLFLVFVSILFFQCQKDHDITSDPGVNNPVVATPEPIVVSLQGNVTDENDKPLPGG